MSDALLRSRRRSTGGASSMSLAEADWALPAGAIAQTHDRNAQGNGSLTITSGQLNMRAIYLRAGMLVSNITFYSAATALSVGSNQWFALYSSARAKLGVTADDTSTAWAANAPKTLALASPYTVTTTGYHYLGICVVASTPPTLSGANGNAGVFGESPVIVGTADSGLTNPASAPATAAALTVVTSAPYARVS